MYMAQMDANIGVARHPEEKIFHHPLCRTGLPSNQNKLPAATGSGRIHVQVSGDPSYSLSFRQTSSPHRSAGCEAFATCRAASTAPHLHRYPYPESCQDLRRWTQAVWFVHRTWRWPRRPRENCSARPTLPARCPWPERRQSPSPKDRARRAPTAERSHPRDARDHCQDIERVRRGQTHHADALPTRRHTPFRSPRAAPSPKSISAIRQ